MSSSFDINLSHDGRDYKGWVRPSARLSEAGLPVSYHVVLNDTLFGNLSIQNDIWVVDEQRPASLTQALGQIIQSFLDEKRKIC
ncbi:MAG: hypothetical protein H7Y27_00120 [Gemmatimonadaceae bacterium]|nr:hypothetical protein [Chitinophagaceae bacterium]